MLQLLTRDGIQRLPECLSTHGAQAARRQRAGLCMWAQLICPHEEGQRAHLSSSEMPSVSLT